MAKQHVLSEACEEACTTTSWTNKPIGGDTKFIVRPVSCPPGMCTTAISMLIFSLWLCFLSARALKKTIRLLSCQMLHYLQQLIAKFGGIWCNRNQLWRDNVVGFSIQRVLPTWNRIQNGNPVSPFILPKYEWLEHMSRQIDTAVLTPFKQKKEKKNVVKVVRRLCVLQQSFGAVLHIFHFICLQVPEWFTDINRMNWEGLQGACGSFFTATSKINSHKKKKHSAINDWIQFIETCAVVTAVQHICYATCCKARLRTLLAMF